MKSHLGLAIALLATACMAHAAEKDYSPCEFAGYAEGEGNNFISSLATKLMWEKGFVNDKICNLVYQDGIKTSEEIRRNKKIKPEQQKVFLAYVAFQRRIESAVLRLAGY